MMNNKDNRVFIGTIGIVVPWNFDVLKTSIFALGRAHQISAGQLSADRTETLYCLNSVSPRMNTIASRDQFKPIRIGENLVVNYNKQLDYELEISIA